MNGAFNLDPFTEKRVVFASAGPHPLYGTGVLDDSVLRLFYYDKPRQGGSAATSNIGNITWVKFTTK